MKIIQVDSTRKIAPTLFIDVKIYIFVHNKAKVKYG